MKPRLLYLGNKLSHQGLAPATLELLSEKLSSKYEVISASGYRNSILRILHQWMLVLRHHRKVHLVLIDTFSTAAFYMAWSNAWLCRMLGIKYLLILHGGNLPLRLKKNPVLCKQVFQPATQLVSPSPYLKSAFRQAGYHNVRIIPNFIEIEKYPFKQRHTVSARLLWVRSFDRIYNPHMAIKVVKQLKQAGMPVQLCMVGPDKDGSMQECRELAEHIGVSENIEFTGLLTKEKWIERAAQSDIFLNTTHIDNTPVSVIEAMALGMCVVSTNVGGIPFILEHEKNAMLVNDNDADSMCAAIHTLIHSPELSRTLSREARAASLAWSWESVAPLWHEILQ
jgi:glycosyltransferase involved in cell wall biosynthesis